MAAPRVKDETRAIQRARDAAARVKRNVEADLDETVMEASFGVLKMAGAAWHGPSMAG
jgi:hypothetical protein